MDDICIWRSLLSRQSNLLWALIAPMLVVAACTTSHEDKSTGRIQGGSGPASCAAETRPVEEMICEDRKLQKLHEELEDVYVRLKAVPQARAPVRESQQSWLRVRNDCLREHCLEMVYRMRIDRMQRALEMCEVDSRLTYSSMAAPTERCQRSLLSLKVSKAGEIMPMQTMEPQVRKVHANLRPVREVTGNTLTPRTLHHTPVRMETARYAKENDNRERIPAQNNRKIRKAIKPGFDCSQKLNYSEMSICSDSYLSGLDNHLNTLYREYQKITPSPESLKQIQLKWLKKRNSCKEYSCIAESYNLRISEIILGIENIHAQFSEPAKSGNDYD
ncbi:lysozyme inhibitor LprI family protein [Microbulbifer rhizosphaerae]|uniref:Lysozyme inhibitor LprI N-terminal domain-containing protein n=1 Tax=Microbulbifer rhizosphaerae TaxID=1562603 RepID=A0A7W4WBM4_9GAMM|nr:hypothetical protein [Microbulbifer rhizosphaerae]MBB3061292.1 uncharacterized protein [Microbulbifer rhizosphaerae]